MKRLVSLFSVCLLMMSLLCCLPVRAAAGLTVTASATTVTVGQNVTVTLKYNGDGNPIGGVIGTHLGTCGVGVSYVTKEAG